MIPKSYRIYRRNSLYFPQYKYPFIPIWFYYKNKENGYDISYIHAVTALMFLEDKFAESLEVKLD